VSPTKIKRIAALHHSATCNQTNRGTVTKIKRREAPHHSGTRNHSKPVSVTMIKRREASLLFIYVADTGFELLQFAE